MQTLPKLYCMGDTVLDSGFYADCPLSKNALSIELKTSRPTVCRHEKIAYYLVANFKEDYPDLPKSEWAQKGRAKNSEVPLSPYQSWVISLIVGAFSQLHKRSAVEGFVRLNPHLFSRKNYHAQLSKVAAMMSA